MPYATAADGTKLWYKDWGRGPTVVLIHGWPLNADSFDDLSVMLNEAGFRTVAYDRRGFGRSDQPATGYEYDTLADDLAAVIDAADDGSEKVAIAGFSMGGGEVARYLSRHGATRISHAALLGAVTPFMLKTDDNPDGAPAEQFAGMEKAIREDRPAFMQTFGKQFYGVGLISKPVSQPVLDWTFQMAMMGGLAPTLVCLRAFAGTDFRPDMAALTVPTLILHGKDDAVVPADATAKKTAKLVPHARLELVGGAPHGMLATHGEEVAAQLIAFLRG